MMYVTDWIQKSKIDDSLAKSLVQHHQTRMTLSFRKLMPSPKGAPGFGNGPWHAACRRVRGAEAAAGRDGAARRSKLGFIYCWHAHCAHNLKACET
jgi:hypothetical protein